MAEDETAEASEKAEEKQDRAPGDGPTQSFDQKTINAFFNTTFEAGASFGVQNAMNTRLSRATGSVDQDDITTALDHFIAPEDFTIAATRLARDRVVVLCGAPGIGKRSSALALLREVTSDVLYMLSPQVPLAELAGRDYESGCGYLVIDRVADRNTTESDFEWRLVRDRLASQKAYLVVTTAAGQAATTESIAHFLWYPPNAEQVLRVYWPQEWPEEHEKTLRDTLESADRVIDVVNLAGRLSDGESPDVAVTHFDARVRDQVDQWFAAKPDRRKILEVATLAFTLGVDERHFEAALALLRNALNEHWPEPESDKAPAAKESMPQLRGQLAENPLMVTTTMPTELGTRGALLFTVPGYHRHALAELWRLMHVAFWDAVQDWLDIIVLRPQYEQRLTIGLAKLADVALDEVLQTLDRWARGQRGSAGQRAAVYTLWLMTYEGSLAPTALQIATKWITRGTPTHRWVAAMAFSGQLGVRYPHEAVNVLWQLCVQSHTVDGDVEMVFGELFSTLVRESIKDAGIVLGVLAGKIERFTRPDARPRMAAVAIRTALSALVATDPLGKRVAVLSYLAEFSDRTEQVAGLIAKVIAYRPVRLRAIRALRTILEDLAKNYEQPEERARALGEALAKRLDPGERATLEYEFRAVVTRKHKDIGPLVAALLNALSILTV